MVDCNFTDEETDVLIDKVEQDLEISQGALEYLEKDPEVDLNQLLETSANIYEEATTMRRILNKLKEAKDVQRDR